MLGRATLVEENNGQRAKVVTSDGNSIDTMFVDFRKRMHPNGKILVVCSEGNTGFYEVGIMHTPLKAGYSVLGWNHPGFAGSTVSICIQGSRDFSSTILVVYNVHV